VLSKHPDVLADPFIAENIDEVSRNMRTKAVLKLIAPYTRFSLQFISKHIKISVSEVLDILSFLILDKKLNAKIDQDSGTVVVESASDVERLRAVGEWSSALRTLWQTALNGEGLRADDTAIGGMFAGFGDEGMRSIGRRKDRAKQALTSRMA
jgi:COP9 signalosome complex subunit 2